VTLGYDVEMLEVRDDHGEDCKSLIRIDDQKDSRHCFFAF
jgi:hypothetical protein